MPNNLLRQPNFGVLVTLVWLAASRWLLLLQYWGQTAETLLDTDDAMRLVADARLARRAGLVRSAQCAGRSRRPATTRIGRG